MQPGERVWSRHEQTGELALKPVVSVMQRESDHLVHLRLGGERISTTVEHPFWVKDKGWTKAGELGLNDLVQRADGLAVAVSEIEHQTEFENDTLPVVYNIEVAEWLANAYVDKDGTIRFVDQGIRYCAAAFHSMSRNTTSRA